MAGKSSQSVRLLTVGVITAPVPPEMVMVGADVYPAPPSIKVMAVTLPAATVETAAFASFVAPPPE